MSKQQQWMRNRAGGPLHKADISCESNGCWPVAVIDVEDREQVALVLSHYHKWKWTADIAEASIDDMQAALREFANPTPPKPDEPQGLGAVVEDADGVTFVRIQTDYSSPWVRRGLIETGALYKYADITAATVLSEGVQS